MHNIYREVLKPSLHGYTKAVDLWSLGCVAFVLLTGGTPFAHIPGTSDESLTLHRLQADLDAHGAGARAKDFTCALLQFDEGKRMDVKQALRHHWFTNPTYKHQLEALYERSVRDWKPRLKHDQEEGVIVDLTTQSAAADMDLDDATITDTDEQLLP